jgi:hypothetical protein
MGAAASAACPRETGGWGPAHGGCNRGRERGGPASAKAHKGARERGQHGRQIFPVDACHHLPQSPIITTPFFSSKGGGPECPGMSSCEQEEETYSRAERHAWQEGLVLQLQAAAHRQACMPLHTNACTSQTRFMHTRPPRTRACCTLFMVQRRGCRRRCVLRTSLSLLGHTAPAAPPLALAPGHWQGMRVERGVARCGRTVPDAAPAVRRCRAAPASPSFANGTTRALWQRSGPVAWARSLGCARGVLHAMAWPMSPVEVEGHALSAHR